jgi:hypothetical protein
MRHLLAQLRETTWDLIPDPRHRTRLMLLVLVGAAIPLVDLLVTKIFTDLITGTDDRTLRDLAPQFGMFLGLFLIMRLAHYGHRIWRVAFLDQAFQGRADGPSSPATEGWQWALGLELVTLLTALVQILVMAAFFVVLAPLFGLLNIVVLALLLHAIGVLFARQLAAQRGFVAQGRGPDRVPSSVRVRSRVRSAEVGGLMSSMAVLFLLALLLGLGVSGLISTANTIVLFLGLRMQNSTVTGLSGGVMRFARATASSLR